MPYDIAGNTCAPSTFHADHVAVFFWEALLAGLAVCVTTTLELTARKICLKRVVIVSIYFVNAFLFTFNYSSDLPNTVESANAFTS